ncbi:MAG: YcbK family protein [bacterium]
MINDLQLTRDFSLKEFECKDGSHQVVVHRELVLKLQKLRDRLGFPIIINSAYRNKTHNKAVGGSDNSQHLKGTAVDISLHNQKLDIETIGTLAEKIGFTGIGYYDTFIHLDVRKSDKIARWDERK